MKIDYATIKALAKEHGLKVDDFLVLNSSNDPFYTGRRAQVQQAEWFHHLWTEFGYTDGVHLRRIHYQLVSQRDPRKANGDRYNNTERDWSYLCDAGKYARVLGLVDVGAFVDQRNPPPIAFAATDPPNKPTLTFPSLDWELPGILLPPVDIEFPWPELHAFTGEAHDLADYHRYHLEVWIEKSTQNDILIPICQELDANLVTGLGFQSYTSVFELLQRIQQRGESARIFYISDFDPAGDRMPVSVARATEFWSQQFDGLPDIRLTPIALNRNQVKAYQLPRIPIKKSDKRKAGFEERMGEGAVELDALEALYPGELARIVREHLAPYRDPELKRKLAETKRESQRMVDADWSDHAGAELEKFHQLKTRASEMVARYQRYAEDLNADLQAELLPIAAELEQLSHVTSERTDSFRTTVLGRPEPPTPDEPPFLYESRRNYTDQLMSYRRFKANGGSGGER